MLLSQQQKKHLRIIDTVSETLQSWGFRTDCNSMLLLPPNSTFTSTVQTKMLGQSCRFRTERPLLPTNVPNIHSNSSNELMFSIFVYTHLLLQRFTLLQIVLPLRPQHKTGVARNQLSRSKMGSGGNSGNVLLLLNVYICFVVYLLLHSTRIGKL
jgi:hypothetical protein